MTASLRQRVAAAVAVALLLAGGAAAYTTAFEAGAGTTYETGSGLTVTAATTHSLNGSNPFVDSETVVLDGVTISANGSADVTVDQFRGTQTKLSGIDATANAITVAPSDKNTVEIAGGVTALAWENATLDGTTQLTYTASGSGTITVGGLAPNTTYAAATTSGTVLASGTTTASGRAEISVGAATDVDVVLLEPAPPQVSDLQRTPANGTGPDDDQTITATISDADFGTDADESVTAEVLVDGTVRETTTLSSNGTVSASVSGLADGSHTYTVRATDAFGGQTTSGEQSFSIDHRAPSATATTGNLTTSAGSVTVDGDISDADFGTDADESVTAALVVDGTTVDSTTVSSNQTVGLTWGDPTAGQHDYSIEVSDAYGGTSSSQTFTITGAYEQPQITNLTPSGRITTRPTQLSAAVSDADFDAGDSVDVTFSLDGAAVGSVTVTRNQTAAVSLTGVDAGSHNVTVTATDSFGTATATATTTFTTPEVIEVRNESAPGQLITGPNITVQGRLFSGELIFKKTATNGTIDMTDLPADRDYVLVLNADGFYQRRTLVDSLYQQQSVYLLPKTVPTVSKSFVLRDVSGNYPADQTQLIIERPLNRSGLRWHTIAGDYFGSSNEYPVVLEDNTRYRLTVQNDAGDQRVLGSYSARTSGTEVLKVKGVPIYRNASGGYVANSTRRDGQVIVRYADPTGQTSAYEVTVYPEGNRSNVTYQDQVYDAPVENYSAYVPVDNDTDTAYVVNWSATRGGQSVGAARPVGAGDLGVRIPLDSQWLGTLGLMIVVLTAALADQRYATHLALATVAMAGLMMYLAVLDLYVPLWWGALLIASGGHLATRGPRS